MNNQLNLREQEFMRLKKDLAIYDFYRKNKKSLSKEVINIKFSQVRGEEIFLKCALEWENINRDLIVKKFMKLKNTKVILDAGIYLKQLTAEDRINKFMQNIKIDNYTKQIPAKWEGITAEHVNSKFLSLSDEYALEVVDLWNINKEVRREKFFMFNSDDIISYNEKLRGGEISDEDEEYKFSSIENEKIAVQVGIKFKSLSSRVINQKFLSLTEDKNILDAGKHWNGIDDINLDKKFLEMTNLKYILEAGQELNISDEVLKKKFIELTGDEKTIVDIGREWTRLSTELLNEKFKELKNEEQIVDAGSLWKGLMKETLNERFLSLKNKESIALAGYQWRIDTGVKIRKFNELDLQQLDLRSLTIIMTKWQGIPKKLKREKFLSINLDNIIDKFNAETEFAMRYYVVEPIFFNFLEITKEDLRNIFLKSEHDFFVIVAGCVKNNFLSEEDLIYKFKKFTKPLSIINAINSWYDKISDQDKEEKLIEAIISFVNSDFDEEQKNMFFRKIYELYKKIPKHLEILLEIQTLENIIDTLKQLPEEQRKNYLEVILHGSTCGSNITLD